MQDIPNFTRAFKQALHMAQLNRLKKRYHYKKGYIVQENYPLDDNLQVDLYVKSKGGKEILFEIFVQSYREREKRRKIKRIEKISKEHDYEFHSVDVLLPGLPDIEIEWLDNALFDYLAKHPEVSVRFADRIEKIAKFGKLERVAAETDSLSINSNTSAYISGVLDVADAAAHTLSIHFSGKIFLDLVNKHIKSMGVIDIDENDLPDFAWHKD